MRLEQADRQRLQVALTSLGFDTRGNDGMFGPRSRDMIAGWQKKVGAPATGFLTAAQRDQLLRAATPAVARWDEEQKKIEDDRRKPDATQAATTLNQPGSGAFVPPASGSSGPGVAGAGSSRAAALRDGTYRGGLGMYARAMSLELRMSNGSGTGTVTSSTCGTGPMSLTVDASGNVTGRTESSDRFNELQLAIRAHHGAGRRRQAPARRQRRSIRSSITWRDDADPRWSLGDSGGRSAGLAIPGWTVAGHITPVEPVVMLDRRSRWTRG